MFINVLHLNQGHTAMSNEEDRRNYEKDGRRSTDKRRDEGSGTQPGVGFRNWFLNGIAVGGVVTALLGIGRASTTLDTAVKSNDTQDQRIEQLFEQNNKLLLALTEQNIQQKESDKRFEEKFDRTIETLEDVKDGVKENSKDIIILQQHQKLSSKDNTGVQIAWNIQ